MVKTTYKVCGVKTPNGPCTMPKGHIVSWHRHRKYEGIEWSVYTNEEELLTNGKGVVPLNKAISDCVGRHDEIVIRVKINSG